MDRGCDEHPLHYYFYLTEEHSMPEPKPEINKVSEHWLLYTYPGEPDMYINLSKIVYLRTVQIAGLDDELLLYMQGSGNISLSGITTADILLVLLP